MRAALVLFAGLMLATGCSADKPAESVVSRIEQQLARDSCLRNIEAMRRIYQFAHRDGRVDRNLIDIDITEAGHRGLPAGRYIVEPKMGGILDDAQLFNASATYVVSTGELDLWACGMNFGGIRHAPRF
jgi:hypothetical protein